MVSATMIMEHAYQDIYNALDKREYPDWYVRTMPDHEKPSFENGEARDIYSDFMETLILKTCDTLLQHGGNAKSVLVANAALKNYGQLIFSIRGNDSGFEDAAPYPISNKVLHDTVIALNQEAKPEGMDYELPWETISRFLGPDYDHFSNDPQKKQIVDTLQSIILARDGLTAVAEGRLKLSHGRVVPNALFNKGPNQRDGNGNPDMPPRG